MNWGSFSEFLHMGGYGFYVWSSFGLSFLLFFGEMLSLRKKKRTLMERLCQMQALDKENNETAS